MESGERTLIERCRNGRRDALRDLVVRHERMVYGLALRMLGDPDEARDAAQETFLNAFRALPGFRGESTLATWIYRIALNACAARSERRRRERARTSSFDADSERGYEPESPDKSPLDALADARERDRLNAAIDALPERYRTIVILRYREELDYAEIAAALEVPMGTVKTWLFRAKELLAARLAEVPEMEGGNDAV